MNKRYRVTSDYFFCFIAIPLLVRLFRISTASASDFEVYWYAIRAWLAGLPPYAQYSMSYPGLVFKYPPWLLPVFLPIGLFPLEVAKWIWTIAQVFAIAYTVRWARRQCRPLQTDRITAVLPTIIPMIVALMFWWMWLAHTEFGQIMVFILALGVGDWSTHAETVPRVE